MCEFVEQKKNWIKNKAVLDDIDVFDAIWRNASQ